MFTKCWRGNEQRVAMAVSSRVLCPKVSNLSRVIHRADYQQVLVEEAIRLGVKLRLGAEVQDVDFENTTVTLQGGEVIAGDVVIGADGRLVHI